MATTKPDLTRVWANGAPPANVVDPDTTTPGKVLSGWQAEVPPFEHFNFLQKWFTQGLAHANEQGIMVWDINTTYPVSGIVKGSDGNLYVCVNEQNGNDPTTDNGDNWSFYLSKSNMKLVSDIASLKNSPLKEGDLVGTLGYYSANGIGSSLGVIKTTAQASSDGDVIDEYGNITLDNGKVYILIDNGTVSVEQFGVVEGSDSGPASNAAADHCRNKNKQLTSMSGKIYTTDESLNFRSIRHLDYKSQINGTGEFPTVVLGGDSNVTQQYYNQYVHKANRGGTLPGVRLVGSTNNTIRVDETSIFEIYADTTLSLGGTDTYSAYNKIHVQSCTTFQINSNAATDGSVVQWINENQIYLQFCLYFKMYDNGYKHNSNQFWGGNFEASDSQIIFETGTANTWRNVRGESALLVQFDSEAENNNIITDWFGFRNAPSNAATVVDNGVNNCVKNLNDIVQDRVTIMSFNGSTLTDDGAGKSNLLGVSAGLTKDPVNNTVTVSPYGLIYESPLIEVSPSREYFDVEVSPKLSGGINMKIDAYDDNMVVIPTGSFDVFYQGGTNEEAGFGETNTTITNKNAQRRVYVNNKNAKYIIITVSASSSGCSFRRFTMQAVSASVDGKKLLETSAMIFNI